MKKIKTSKTIIIMSLCLAVSVRITGCGMSEADTSSTASEEKSMAVETKTETISEPERVQKDYAVYLEWTAEEFLAASAEEQENAAIAYGAYITALEGHENTVELMEEMADRLSAVSESMKQAFKQEETAGLTLKELAISQAGAAADFFLNLEEIDLGAYEEYLDYTAKDWENADDTKRKEVTKAYAMVVMAVNGISVEAEDLEGAGVDMEGLKALLEEAFKQTAGTTCSLRDMLSYDMEESK